MWDELLNQLQGTTQAKQTPAPVPAPAPVDPNNESPVVNVASLVPTLKSSVGSLQEKAGQADALLGQFSTLQQVVQAGNEKAMAEAVKAKEGVNAQIQSQTQDFTKSVQPVFQQRNEIAARRVEISQMNPFVAAFKGLFNPNYDPDHLNEVDDALKGQLTARGLQYQQLMGINDTVLKTIDQHYEDQVNPANLALNDKQADVTTAMQAVGSIQQVIGSALQGINANSDVLKANAMARQDVLGRMTLDDANRYAAAAQKGGGTAVVNGVPISAAEIKDVQQHWQEQNLNLESRQLAITAQRSDLAETYERRAIAHMSAPQVEAAIANGGKLPNGQQLNQNYLTEAYANTVRRNDIAASQAAQAGGVQVYGAMLKGLHGVINQGTSRATSLFGQTPVPIQQQTQSMAIRLQQIAEGQKKADTAGAGDSYAAQMAPEVQKMAMQFNGQLEDIAKKWGNGDPNLTAVARSWLVGEPMNPGTAAAGMITMARKGIPPGMQMTPQSAAIFKQVQGAVHSFDSQQNNPMSMVSKAHLAKGEIDPGLLDRVQSMIQNAHTDKSMQTVLAMAPKVAQQQGLEFGKMESGDIAAATAAGDATGARETASHYGLSAQQLTQIFDDPNASGPDGAAFAAYKKHHPTADYGEMAQTYQTRQMRGTLDALDHIGGQKGLGFKPSQAYAEMLNNPQFVQMMTNMTQARSGQSAGDFMVDNIAGTNFSANLMDYGRLAAQTHAAATGQKINQALDTSAKLRGYSPQQSMRLALYTNPNLTSDDINKLVVAVNKEVDASANIPLNEAITGSTETISNTIDRVITQGKFQDPALERIRRIAAQDWATRHARLKQGIVEAFENPFPKMRATDQQMKDAQSIYH